MYEFLNKLVGVLIIDFEALQYNATNLFIYPNMAKDLERISEETDKGFWEKVAGVLREVFGLSQEVIDKVLYSGWRLPVTEEQLKQLAEASSVGWEVWTADPAPYNTLPWTRNSECEVGVVDGVKFRSL